jgi:hypothetical protein
VRSVQGRQLDLLEDELQALLARLGTGDPTAPAEFAERVVREYADRRTLIAALKEKGWLGSEQEAREELTSIVGLFVAKLLRNPAQYRPEKGPIGAFINMAIRGDIANHAAKLRGIKDRPTRSDSSVGEAIDEWNPPMTLEEEVLEGMVDVSPDELEKVRHLVDPLPPSDREVLVLMLEGVREFEPCAEVLGITHLDPRAQQREVNKVKDRLNKKIKRLQR